MHESGSKPARRPAGTLMLIIVLEAVLVISWGAATAPAALREFEATSVSSITATDRMPLSTRIYDRKGRLLNEVFDQARRTYVALSGVSPLLVQATIATEDASFYQNWGISWQGLGRAAWHNLFHASSIQGGSSITQQLVKNTIISEEERYERSVLRKAKELLLAVLLARRYSKDQILEWYLNQIFYGNNSYGVEAAAHAYFGKRARDLALAEAALLAGIPAGPALYDPYTRLDRARDRQRTVLNLMVRHGYITEQQARVAAEAPLRLQPRRFAMEAPHFVMSIREILEARYGPDVLYRGGLRVTTSLDIDLQREAEAIIREHVNSPTYEQRHARNAALVALRPATGEMLALVGSADFQSDAIQGQVNMALAPRQPGSAFKPFVYLTAFTKGWTPATRVSDAPASFPDGKGGQWAPTSADGRYRGWVSAREALAMSLNIPAVRALQHAGVPETRAMAHRLGITSPLPEDCGLALALGCGEVTLLDLSYAYATLASGGVQAGQPRPREQIRPGTRERDPVLILRVEAPNGKVLEEFTQPERRQVLAAPFAYLMTDILADDAARAPFFGSHSPLVLPGRTAAVKTGSTDGSRDAWTVGYTPDLTVGVWVGNAGIAPMADAFGSVVAAPIWNAFMVAALRHSPPRAFVVPPGLVRVSVCASTGVLATACKCRVAREEIFVQSRPPDTACPSEPETVRGRGKGDTKRQGVRGRDDEDRDHDRKKRRGR